MTSVLPCRRRILIVDDDLQVAGLMRRLLEAEGHIVTHARNGQEALDFLAARLPDLVFLDLDMPRVNGYEVCRRIKSDPRSRLLPVVVLSGTEAPDARLRVWDLGADDFLTKPFQGVEVIARCRALLRLKDLIDELDNAESVLFAFARSIDAKSRYTLGHSERVTKYALDLASYLGLSDKEKEVLHRGASLHDIGKLAVPDRILDKPGTLTKEEWEIIKQHPLVGVRIVEPLRSVRETIPLIRWHHERLDGKGYPDGLFGGSIPLLVRVLSVADVFDALSSERPYRQPMPLEVCLDCLRANAAGGGLDPELVRRFCEMTAAEGSPIPASASVLHR